MTKSIGFQVPRCVPRCAMVLAAGLGLRMRPLTDDTPKPLVAVGGKALIDHVLDRLAEAGVEIAVVNVHYLADQIERHLAGRRMPRIVISDEREELLDQPVEMLVPHRFRSAHPGHSIRQICAASRGRRTRSRAPKGCS